MDRYERRSRDLSRRFLASMPPHRTDEMPCEEIHADGRAHLICRLQILWAEFSRELIVKSAIGGCRTRNGRVLSSAPQVKTVADVSNVLGAKSGLQSPHMKWEEAEFSVRCAQTLRLGNVEEINRGLGSAQISNIKTLRNFLVHPNKRTRTRYEQVARDLAMPGLRPDELLSQRTLGGPTMFETWIERLLIAASNAVE